MLKVWNLSHRRLQILREMLQRLERDERTWYLLPLDELGEVLSLSHDKSRDLAIGCSFDEKMNAITIVRGNLETIIAPASLFTPSGTTSPDFSQLSVIDHGMTIKMGDYESSVDAIFYDVDPEYRRRMDKRRMATRRYQSGWQRIKGWTIDVVEDSMGDKALEIWIILDNSTTDAEVTGEKPREIESNIRESLNRLGVKLFPYIHFAREREYLAE